MRTHLVLPAAIVLVALVLLPAGAPGQGAGGVKGEGTEDRDWIAGPGDPPDSISQPEYEVDIFPELIPTRDGEFLEATVFLPQLPEGQEPGPCVMQFNGYRPPAVTAMFELIFNIRGLDAGWDVYSNLAKRGYAFVHVWTRGTDDPEDKELYLRYGEDGYDAVEWLADQDWLCDGKVGMVGASLHGISQWLTAAETPPSLKAIAPRVGCGDCYGNLWYVGGMLPGPGREGRQYPVTPYNEYGAAIRHRNYDAWWRDRDTDTSDHRRMAGKVAVLNVGGWDDYIYGGGVRATEEVVAAGGDGTQILGPWGHVDAGDGPDLLPYSLHEHTVLWFDRFLKGVDNGIDDRGALIYVEGAEQWRHEEEWPIPDAHSTQLYLREEASGSASSLNDGSLASTPSDGSGGSVAYHHDPDGPYNDAGGGSARPTRDQRVDEEHSLTWTTDELTTPTEVTGWPRLTFWASSSAPDTDFVVEVSDVAPDGTSTQVGRGWLNAPRYFSRTDPKRLKRREIYRFEVEVWPMSRVFEAGHRIRLSLAGSDSGGDPPEGPFATQPGLGVNPNPATVTVYQDADHQSRVDLPVIGTGWQQFD